MGSFLPLLGLLGVVFSSVLLIKAFFGKKPKKKYGVWLAGGFIVMLAGGALIPSPQLHLEASTFDTNTQGVAIIKGETDKNSKITIDGKDVPVKGNHFSYKYTLKKGKQKKLKIVAVNKEKIERYKTVTVKPTKAFIASLDTKAKKQLTKVDNALKTAEKTPTQVNYDEAATLVAS